MAKYDDTRLRSNRVKVGKKILKNKNHPKFHKTVNALTLGAYASAVGTKSAEHKAYARKLGYKASHVYYRKAK